MAYLTELDLIIDSVYPSQINLKSFETKDILNNRIWTNGDLKQPIRKRLYNIATEFIDDIELPGLTISDIVLVGSIAGYNWSKFSDIDLHIIVDMDKLSEKYGSKDVLKKMFDDERNLFNKKHNDLFIYGYPVELYVQDVSEENASNGIYSVMNGRWIKIPKSGNVLTNKTLIKKKAAQFINVIDKYAEIANRRLSEEQYIILRHRLDKIHDEIITGRRTSLAKDGEYAPDNIVFKVLRRSGHLGKLNDARVLVYDKLNSIKTKHNKKLI